MQYSTHRFDDVIVDQRFSADGEPEGEAEYENEDSVEYEGEETDPSLGGESFEADYEAPKYRQLVKQKKLALKAEFGKAHIGTRRECKNLPYPGFKKETKTINYPCPTFKDTSKKCSKTITIDVPTTLYKEVCINIPVWVPGWRKRWRDFKKSGGLAQLKMMAKGMIPYVPITTGIAPVSALPTEISSTLPVGPTGSGPKGGKRAVGAKPLLIGGLKPDDTEYAMNAGFNMKSALGIGLALALLTGGIYAFAKNK